MRTPRDMEIINLVKQYGQVRASWLREVVFHANRSHTPCDEVLKRLYNDGYLSRPGRTLVTVERGGSGEYIYSLGRKAWPLFYTGRKYSVRSVPYPHTLAVSDVYLYLLRAERAGKLKIVKVITEPGSHRVIGGQKLEPDLYVRVATDRGELRLFVEVDLATENKTQVAGQIEAYREAFSNDDELDVFPMPLFLVSASDGDVTTRGEKIQRRVDYLEKLIARIPDEQTRSIFKVERLDQFPQPWMM